MTTIPGYYTTQEIAELLSLTRQRVASLARREGWASNLVGNAALYPVDDVREYRDTRYRTQLLKKAGWWSGRGLYRDGDIDVGGGCPECGKFAIEHPDMDGRWVCLEGHKGESI